MRDNNSPLNNTKLAAVEIQLQGHMKEGKCAYEINIVNNFHGKQIQAVQVHVVLAKHWYFH